jgi:hypothetical protein
MKQVQQEFERREFKRCWYTTTVVAAKAVSAMVSAHQEGGNKNVVKQHAGRAYAAQRATTAPEVQLLQLSCLLSHYQRREQA